MLEIIAPVAAAFAALDEGGVRWCLLRGADELARPVGDIDLLVDEQSLDHAARILYGLGFGSPNLPGRGSPEVRVQRLHSPRRRGRRA